MLCRVHPNVLGDRDSVPREANSFRNSQRGRVNGEDVWCLPRRNDLSETVGVKPGLCNFAKRKRLEGKGFIYQVLLRGSGWTPGSQL